MNIADIQKLIQEFIEKTTIPVKKISINEDKPKHPNSEEIIDESTMWFSVEVDQPHYFLDFNGEALFALNHLIKKIVENNSKEEEMGKEILVDVNGFQKRKVENIYAIAHMMAERARYFKSNIEVDPMSAFERRIVHEFLSNEQDLKTESTGEGRTRRVVIKYIGNI